MGDFWVKEFISGDGRGGHSLFCYRPMGVEEPEVYLNSDGHIGVTWPPASGRN